MHVSTKYDFCVAIPVIAISPVLSFIFEKALEVAYCFSAKELTWYT